MWHHKYSFTFNAKYQLHYLPRQIHLPYQKSSISLELFVISLEFIRLQIWCLKKSNGQFDNYNLLSNYGIAYSNHFQFNLLSKTINWKSRLDGNKKLYNILWFYQRIWGAKYKEQWSKGKKHWKQKLRTVET